MANFLGEPAPNIKKTIPMISGGLVALSDASLSLPFYGMEKIPLGRESTWEITPAGPQSVAIAAWNGSLPLEYEFNFELVAGYTVADRKALLGKMRVAHALTSHRISGGVGTGGGKDGKVLPPPAVLLILGDYIQTIGIIKRIQAIGNPPFNDNMEPTSVTFQGQFIALPGYNEEKGIVQVSKNNTFLSFDSIKENFYNVNKLTTQQNANFRRELGGINNQISAANITPGSTA